MKKETKDKYNKLVTFWNSAFKLDDNDKDDILISYKEDDWKSLAPSEKLLNAILSLNNVGFALDYGCGTGFASIALAKTNNKVLSVDVSTNGIEYLKLLSKVFNVTDKVETLVIDSNWLKTQTTNSFDCLVCSNVLDVIPLEMTKDILKEFGRILKPNAKAVISLNYYIDKEMALKMNVNEENELYIDGVLRLLNKSDDEWSSMLQDYFIIEKIDHFAWESEGKERRRLFYLKKK